MKEKRIERQILIAEQKIKLSLWSVDYAKGYCYALLDEDLNNGVVINDEYNMYADRIDNLTENSLISTTASYPYSSMVYIRIAQSRCQFATIVYK